MSINGIVFDIQRGSFVDGPGIRSVIFFKGCNLKCVWCHNPEGQSPYLQMMLFKNKCINCGKCLNLCPSHMESCDFCEKCVDLCPQSAREVSGKSYSVDEIMSIILKDKHYYGKEGGVTFSGGECMLQIDFLSKLLKKCKEYGIHTCVDTAGSVSFEFFEKIIPFTDLFLYDLKIMDNELHKRFVGVENTLILENLKKLLSIGTKIWVRIPVISEINDSDVNFYEIKRFFNKYGYPEKIELLPYHSMGEHKYLDLGLEIPKFSSPSKAHLTHLREILY